LRLVQRNAGEVDEAILNLNLVINVATRSDRRRHAAGRRP
jgi:hypothetical protein